MKCYYANLLGNWTDITDTGTVEGHQSPSIYFEENSEYLNGSKRAKWAEYDYINVQHEGKNYRIHTSMIQIVTF